MKVFLCIPVTGNHSLASLPLSYSVQSLFRYIFFSVLVVSIFTVLFFFVSLSIGSGGFLVDVAFLYIYDTRAITSYTFSLYIVEKFFYDFQRFAAIDAATGIVVVFGWLCSNCYTF